MPPLEATQTRGELGRSLRVPRTPSLLLLLGETRHQPLDDLQGSLAPGGYHAALVLGIRVTIGLAKAFDDVVLRERRDLGGGRRSHR